MRQFVALAAIALAACSTTTPNTTAGPQSAAPRGAATQDQATAGTSLGGFGDLEAMTFGCPKAGLNAAAREAGKAPAKGKYQFSYFKLISDSHHSMYEVHFASNNYEDPELKYCVSVYCQQGWDPKTTKATVELMGGGPKAAKPGAPAAGHAAHCGGDEQIPAKRRSKR
jgi:hypothetical protein